MKPYHHDMISAIVEAFDYSDDAIGIVDFESDKLIYYNKQWLKMNGVDESRDYRGVNIREFKREDHHHLFSEFMGALRKSDQVRKRVSTNIPGRRSRTLDILVNIIRRVSPPLAVVIIRDVTEYVKSRKELQAHRDNLNKLVKERTEKLNRVNQTLQEKINENRKVLKKLQESEDTFKSLYKSIPLPTYTWIREGDDFRLADYNDAAVDITDGGISNYVGMTASRMYSERPSIREDLNECFSKKINIEREVKYHYLSTDRNRYLAVKYAFVPPDMVLVHTEDITERKIAEEELKKYRDHLENLIEQRTSTLKEKNRELNLMNEVNRTIISRENPRQSLDSMLKLLAGFLNTRHAGLYKLDCEKGTAIMLASIGIHEKIGERLGEEMIHAESIIKYLDNGKAGEAVDPGLIYQRRSRSMVIDKGINRTVVFPVGSRNRKSYFVVFDLISGENIPVGSSKVMRVVGEQIEIALERMELLEKLERREKELKELTCNLFDRIEEDRKKMAMNLHDDMVQSLISLNLEFDMLREKLTPDKEKEHSIRVIKEQLKRITNNTRMYSYQLRPPMLDDLGLIPAIKSYAKKIEERNNIDVKIESAGFDVELPVQIALTIYRVVQEALTNAVRHSGASKVSIRLTKGYPRVIIVIEDDGSGFELRRDGTIPGGLGIIGMRERVEMWGGDFQINSGQSYEGEGTRIRFTLPLEV